MHKAHISGNNLFVSAYHGFALMGNEHTPAPQPFRMPPPFLVSFEAAIVEDGDLLLTVDAHVSQDAHPERYRLYSRLRLTYPGKGYGVRGMRGFLAEGDCSGQMTIRIPAYTEICNLTEERFQIQAMSILLPRDAGRGRAERPRVGRGGKDVHDGRQGHRRLPVHLFRACARGLFVQVRVSLRWLHG